MWQRMRNYVIPETRNAAKSFVNININNKHSDFQWAIAIDYWIASGSATIR